MSKSELTAKQNAFVNEFMLNRNATQAAVKAGYSEKTARVIGPENLLKPAVKKEIEKRTELLSKKNEVTIEKVVEELSKGGFAEIDISQMKYGDKIKCLELLCKHLGMLEGPGSGKAKDRSGASGRVVSALGRIRERIGERGSKS